MTHPAPTRALLTVLCMLLLQVVAVQPAAATVPTAEKPVLLRSDPPTWLTPDTREKVHEASLRGLGYDGDTGEAVPRAAMSFAFIRPGTLMVWPSICTIGFVYGSPGNYQLVTAGHCVNVGDRVIIASAPNLVFEIGTATSSTHPTDGGTGPDYARILVDDQWQSSVDADVADVFGPQGGVDTNPVDGDHPAGVKYVGWGMAGTPRACVVDREAWDGTFYGYCPVSYGDSGAPVLSVGAAFPLGQGFGIINGFLPTTNQIAWGTRLTVVGNDLVLGDVTPVPDYCPPPSNPPNGIALTVCGDTGYATMTATSTVTSCSGDSAHWTCRVLHRIDLFVSDLSGCADAFTNSYGVSTCSALYIPSSASISVVREYDSIPPGGTTIVIPHTLCLTEVTRTTCTSGMETLLLQGPSPPPPGGIPGKTLLFELLLQIVTPPRDTPLT